MTNSGLLGVQRAWGGDYAFEVAHRAVRSLVRRPVLPLIVVTTLGVAIAANTLIFSFVNVLVLEPLPLGNPDRVVLVYSASLQRGIERGSSSLDEFVEWRSHSTTFEYLAAVQPRVFVLSGTEAPGRIRGQAVSADFFPAWGLGTEAGRTFLPDEDLPGGTPTVLLSHGFWSRQYGADPDVIGQSLDLDGVRRTVIGVVDPDIEIGTLSTIDVWVPLTLEPDAPDAGVRNLQVTGLLKPGVPPARADEELSGLAMHLGREGSDWRVRVLPFAEAMTVPSTWIILGLATLAVLLVFVLACANVAALLTTRALDRQREMAVHLALGAARRWILGPLALEAMILSILSGGVGIYLAHLGLKVVRLVTYEPFFKLVELRGSVLVAAIALAVLSPLLFGLIPALLAVTQQPASVLRSGGQVSDRSVVARWVHPSLVIGQLALAVVLSVASVLTVRTAVALEQAEGGYDTQGILALKVEFPAAGNSGEPGSRYATPELLAAAQRRVLDALSAPGEGRLSAATNKLPRVESETVLDFRVDGAPEEEAEAPTWAVTVDVTSGYFATLRVPLVRGRTLSEARGGGDVAETVVSLEAARRYFGSAEGALGEVVYSRSSLGADEVPLTIVGVAGDVQGGSSAPKPYLYRPLMRFPGHHVSFLVRMPGDPDAAAPAASATVRRVEPGAAIEARSLASYVWEVHANERLTAGIFSAFAVVALLLSSGGLYGLIRHSVATSTAEIGMRRALGASSGRIVGEILLRSTRLVGLGLVLGLALSLPVALRFRGWAAATDPLDPWLYLGVGAVVVVVSLVATLGPLRVAVALDPVKALRSS